MATDTLSNIDQGAKYKNITDSRLYVTFVSQTTLLIFGIMYFRI